MPSKKCPNCNLINPDSAMICDCGYNFSQGTVRKSPQEPAQSIWEETISKIRADSDVIEEERDKELPKAVGSFLMLPKGKYRNTMLWLFFFGFLPGIGNLRHFVGSSRVAPPLLSVIWSPPTHLRGTVVSEGPRRSIKCLTNPSSPLTNSI